MLRTNVPRAVRLLRRRRGWRQQDLALRAGVSRQGITRIELGQVKGVPLATFVRVAEALGGSLDFTMRWEGEQLDRLTDAAHAWMTERVSALLTHAGWTARPEVSFNHFGDRGRVDLLAWHPAIRVLAVVEVKSAVGDLQETLGRLDVKARLGQRLAAEAGWGSPAAVVRILVIGDSRRARQTVRDHDALFAAFRLRGRAARAWMGHPRQPFPPGLMWFVTVPDAHGAGLTRHRRVRTCKIRG
jgi:transcriptional regulator with XRE-family HTH domain